MLSPTREAGFPKKPGGFYSTETFTDKLLEYIGGRQSDPALKEKPFFAYYPFTAPHWPLQAPQEIRDKYKGMYDDGWHKLKERRLAAQVKLGLMEEGVVPRQMDNPFNIEEWDELSAEQKAKSARAMETVRGVGPNANSWIQYAAMVEMIDTNVGRVVKQLENDGELDNTVRWRGLVLVSLMGVAVHFVHERQVGSHNSRQLLISVLRS